jgi:predicted negative regulator of RcsB-dependent stress response
VSDYLSDEEQVERIKKWWSANGTSLIVMLALAIGGVIGWRYYNEYSLAQSEAASDSYRAFLDTRQAGDESLKLASEMDPAHSGTAYEVFTLLYQARDASELEDWDYASDLLVRSIEIADEEVVKDLARIRLARIRYQLDQPDAALALLGAALSTGFASDVAELTGDIHLRRGETSLAIDAYKAALESASEGTARTLIELKLSSISHDISLPSQLEES